MNAFVKFGGYSAILGGLLKLIAAVIPYVPQSAGLELLYGLIDAALLLGLIAFYFRTLDRTGTMGLISFIVAVISLASIIGPDATMFGMDFYTTGGTIFSIALTALAIQLIRTRICIMAAFFWIASLAIGIILTLFGTNWAFLAAGVALSLGFIAVGIYLLRDETNQI
jgi:hypothetical protein